MSELHNDAESTDAPETDVPETTGTDGETVGDLTERLGSSQQNVSKHLGVLHRAGLVRRSKDRTYVHYEIADPGVFELCDQVCGGVRRQIHDLDQILTGEIA